MKTILMLHFLVLILFNFVHPVTPSMLQAKQSPDYVYGMLYLWASIGMLVASPYWGNKMDRTGTKLSMTISPIGYAVGNLILVLSPTGLGMMLGRLIAGLFSAAWMVGVASYISLKSKEGKAKYYGYSIVAGSLGGIFGQLLSGYIGANNYLYSFAFSIICLVIMTVVIYFVTENLFPQKKVTEKVSLKNIHHIIKSERLLFLLLTIMMFSIIQTSFLQSANYFAAKELGFTSIEIGRLVAFSLSIILVCNLFLIDFLQKRFSFIKIYYVEIFGIFCGFFLLMLFFSGAIPQTKKMYYIIVIVMMVSLAIYRPFVMNYVAKLESEPGEVMGIVNSSVSFGRIFGSIIITTYAISAYIPFVMIGFFALLSFIFLSIYVKVR